MADATPDSVLEDEHPTGELRIDDTAQVPVVDAGGADHGSDEFSALFTGEADEWPTQGPAKGLRLPWPVAGLLVLLLAFGGLWAGAYMQRSSSSSSSSTSPFGRSFSLPGGGAPGRTSSGGTSGTVTDIIGSTLYVTTASGSLVAVTVGTNATVDRNAKSSLSALQPGDTVTVQGTKAKDGTVTASSVSATQSGVTSGAAAFGGAGFSGAASGSAGG